MIEIHRRLGERRLRSFRHDRRGVSAVEFALILPLMLLLFAGSVELSEALAVDRKASRVASTVGDLFTQRSSINHEQAAEIMAAAQAIMQPYSTGSLEIIVYGVYLKDGEQLVSWSFTSPGATVPQAEAPPPTVVPSEIMMEGTQTVVTEVDYYFESPFSSFMKSALNRSTDGYQIQHTYMMRPRLSEKIEIQLGP